MFEGQTEFFRRRSRSVADGKHTDRRTALLHAFDPATGALVGDSGLVQVHPLPNARHHQHIHAAERGVSPR